MKRKGLGERKRKEGKTRRERGGKGRRKDKKRKIKQA